MTESTTPLDGVVVLALEAAVSAPFATRQLADLGATVIKIERRDGGDFARHYDAAIDGSSAFFVWANRAKQSLALDIKEPVDRDTFDRLVGSADVFIQNLSPAAASRLGVTAEQLRELHPTLIACDISGYGQHGPRTNDKAYDLTVQAEGGAIALTGTPEAPCKIGFSVSDIAAAMYALSSILAALFRKERTGQGATIDVSMLECMAEWTAAPTYAAVGIGTVPPRSGHRHTMIAPYGIFPLADGTEVLIAVQNDRDWAAFTHYVLGDDTLTNDERFSNNGDRIANVVELEAVVNTRLSSISAEEVRDRLRRGEVAHGSVLGPLQLWEHEQLRAREHFMTVTTPTGSAETYRPPFRIDGLPLPDAVVPALDRHDSALIERLLADARDDRGPRDSTETN